MARIFTLPSGRLAKWVVAGCFLLLCLPVAGAFSGKFEDAQKNETSSFLPSKAESVKALDAVKRYPGGELAPAVVVFARDGGLTAPDRARIAPTVPRLNANRPPLVLPAGKPVFSPDGAAAIISQPVQPGAGQSD